MMGEFGHAMPVMSHSADTTVSCHEHEARSTEDRTQSSGNHDCCKSGGGCECPCLQAPCVMMTNANILTLVESPQPVVSFEGLPQLRPSGVFRPPAQLS